MRAVRWLCRILILMLGSAAVAAAAAPPTLSAADRAAIEALEQRVAFLPGRPPGPPASLAQRMAEARVPGVSIAFIEEGRVKWARAYGEAAAGQRRAVTPGTRFQAASLSKAVAAAGALRMVDRGGLSLDEDVDLRLRGWRIPAGSHGGAAKVTLRRLLSHTAGLNVSGYPGYAAGAAVPTIVQSLAGAAPANTAAVRPFRHRAPRSPIPAAAIRWRSC